MGIVMVDGPTPLSGAEGQGLGVVTIRANSGVSTEDSAAVTRCSTRSHHHCDSVTRREPQRGRPATRSANTLTVTVPTKVVIVLALN
ncbi:MAG: hypothetical protein Q8M65_10810 [Rhodoglobus sp.]|nr:hypothetical protein [Rhodoglobus sp.]